MRQRKSYLKQKLSLQNDQDTNFSIFPAAGDGPRWGPGGAELLCAVTVGRGVCSGHKDGEGEKARKQEIHQNVEAQAGKMPEGLFGPRNIKSSIFITVV